MCCRRPTVIWSGAAAVPLPPLISSWSSPSHHAFNVTMIVARRTSDGSSSSPSRLTDKFFTVFCSSHEPRPSRTRRSQAGRLEVTTTAIPSPRGSWFDNDGYTLLATRKSFVFLKVSSNSYSRSHNLKNCLYYICSVFFFFWSLDKNAFLRNPISS